MSIDKSNPVKKVSIICSKGTIEDIYAALVMGNGAVMEGIELTEKHFQILNYLRDRFSKGEALSIRGINKSGIVDVKDFYQMFPGAPLKKSTKIAGIPKPESCV